MLTYPYMFMTFNQVSMPSSSQEHSDRMSWGCCKHTHSAMLCHVQWAQYWLNWRAMTAFRKVGPKRCPPALQNYCNEFHVLILKQGKLWDMRACSLVWKHVSKISTFYDDIYHQLLSSDWADAQFETDSIPTMITAESFFLLIALNFLAHMQAHRLEQAAFTICTGWLQAAGK